MLCNGLNVAETKCNGNFTFSVIDSLGVHSYKNVILSFDAVCAGSPVIIMVQKIKK